MTNPTPHGQVPAIQRYSIGYHTDEWGQRSSTPSGIPDASGSWVRYEDHAAALCRLHTENEALRAQQQECGNTPYDEGPFALEQPAPATQQVGEVPASIEQLAVARYKVVPAHESMFHRWAVVAGDGAQQLYIGREVECENMTRKFAGAFLDGAFLALQNATPQPAPSTAAAGQPGSVAPIWSLA